MRFHYLTALTIAFLFSIGRADATLTNGGFETGLSGWSTIGDVSVTGSIFGIAPVEGINQVVLTNGPAYRYGLMSELIQPISGNPSVTAWTSPSNYESFFGISPVESIVYQNWGLAASYFSGIKITFQANSGGQLSFQWNLLYTLQPYPAVFILDGIEFCLGRIDCDLGLLDIPVSSAPSVYDWQTGYQSFNIPILTSGLHSIGFAVFAHSDQEGANALLVDGVSVHPVAEPGTLLLLAFGLAGLMLRWRRKTD
jgi:PEP-CTERM motif-containing protein